MLLGVLAAPAAARMPGGTWDTACFEAYHEAYRKHMQGFTGHYYPACDHNGLYKKIQCHSGTGFCWCSDPLGNEMEGTRQRGRPDCGHHNHPCIEYREHAINSHNQRYKAGLHIPTCDEKGDYTPLQCVPEHGSCWCVDKDGDMIEGTHTDRTDCDDVDVENGHHFKDPGLGHDYDEDGNVLHRGHRTLDDLEQEHEEYMMKHHGQNGHDEL